MDLSNNILYEDNDILAVNKPSGLVVHPDGRTQEPSVSEWFAEKYPLSINVGEKLGEIERPGIVHRIDRETSGILLIAKTDKGYKCLKEQFQKRNIKKVYHLFVYGNIKDESGIIDLPISRSKRDFRQRVASKDGEKEALTQFQVLKRGSDKTLTLVEALPLTGRTHQIRVHFKAIHHPIVCDKLYAPKKKTLLGFTRLALHAYGITFKNTSDQQISLKASYPEDFQRAMDIVG